MIILMGVAGSGKSTQGKLLADEYGYAWISTGEVFRLLVTGRRRQEMLNGKLLSDDEVTTIMDKLLDLVGSDQDFVLDGFPRTVKQAEWLFEQASHGRFKLRAVFNLAASEDVVLQRLLGRGRPDDTQAGIDARFKAYQEQTEPILNCFKQKQVPFFEIDASQPAQVVHEQIMANIKSL